MMIEVILDSLAWIPKDIYSEAELILLKRRLIVIPKKTSEFSDPQPVQTFVEKPDVIGIPKEFFLQKVFRKNVFKIVDKISMGSALPADLEDIELRDYQKPFVSGIISRLEDHYGCCAEANTSFGKTICALKLIKSLGRTALVIVHKSTLAEQWVKRIKGDPNESDPLLKRGFLPSARVGLVGDGKVNYKDKDIVIGMVQTLFQKDLPDDFYNYFGTVISDESHRMGSEKWGGVIPRMNARYLIGVSATVRRKDKAENVFFYHLGKTAVKGELGGGAMSPSIYFIDSGFKLIGTPGFDPDILTRVQVISYLVNSGFRNNFIVREMMKAIRAKRNVVAISDRVEHLETLINMLSIVREREGLTFSIGHFYKGDRRPKKEELDAAKQCDVIMCTYKMMEEGEDIKRLDTLMMLTPLSDAEQSVGRVLRELTGKKDPIVVDITDNDIKKCRDWYFSRRTLYAKKGWKTYEVKQKTPAMEKG